MELSAPGTAAKSNTRHKRKKKPSASFKANQRSISEGGKNISQPHDVSRQSSTGSSAMSLDVRCACQFYQCDSLLPERLNPSRPNSRLSNAVSNSRYVV